MQGDVTVEILREIRDEIRGTRHELKTELGELKTELKAELGELKAELGATRQELSERLSNVEGATLEVAQQQRFVVRYLKGFTARDRALEAEVADLRGRVEILEKKSKR
jgi:hypothetical protein